MGVDLKLLIVDGRIASGGYSHTMLEFGRDYALYTRLEKAARTIPGFKISTYVATIPDGSWKDECGYGDVTDTPYGEPLTFVSSEEFLEACQLLKPSGQFQIACLAYIRALDKDTLIGLYFH